MNFPPFSPLNNPYFHYSSVAPPVQGWYDIIGEKTIADAILDRLIHQSHRLELKGESMRKKRGINRAEN